MKCIISIWRLYFWLLWLWRVVATETWDLLRYVHVPLQPQLQLSDWQWSHSSGQSTGTEQVTGWTEVSCTLSVLVTGNLLWLWRVVATETWDLLRYVHVPLQPQLQLSDWQWSHSSGQSTGTEQVTGWTEVSCTLSVLVTGNLKVEPTHMKNICSVGFFQCILLPTPLTLSDIISQSRTQTPPSSHNEKG